LYKCIFVILGNKCNFDLTSVYPCIRNIDKSTNYESMNDTFSKCRLLAAHRRASTVTLVKHSRIRNGAFLVCPPPTTVLYSTMNHEMYVWKTHQAHDLHDICVLHERGKKAFLTRKPLQDGLALLIFSNNISFFLFINHLSSACTYSTLPRNII
jgi:hypothetical protein